MNEKTIISKFNNRRILVRKRPYPICLDCHNLILLKQILISPDHEVTINYECNCKKKTKVIIGCGKYIESLYFYLNVKTEKCGYCNTSSIRYCHTCSKNICKKCSDQHMKHTILEYEIKNLKSVCADHPKSAVTHYCFLCNKSFCSICKKNHNNHDIKTLKGYSEYVKKYPSILNKKNSYLDLNPEISEEIRELEMCYEEIFKEALEVNNITSIHSMLTLKSKPPIFTNIIYKSIGTKLFQSPLWLVKKFEKLDYPLEIENVLCFDNGRIGILFSYGCNMMNSYFHLYEHNFSSLIVQVTSKNIIFDCGIVEDYFVYFFSTDEAQLWDMKDKPKCIRKFKCDTEACPRRACYIGNFQFITFYIGNILVVDFEEEYSFRLYSLFYGFENIVLFGGGRVLGTVLNKIVVFNYITRKPEEKTFVVPKDHQMKELRQKCVLTEKKILFCLAYCDKEEAPYCFGWDIESYTLKYITSLKQQKYCWCFKILATVEDYILIVTDSLIYYISKNNGEVVLIQKLKKSIKGGCQDSISCFVLCEAFLIYLLKDDELCICG